jgi:hypothetical protein
VVDHSGRLGHYGGIGMLVGDGKGKLRQFRGDKEITEEQAEKEKQEFTVTVPCEDYDPKPIRSIISRVGNTIHPTRNRWGDYKDFQKKSSQNL